MNIKLLLVVFVSVILFVMLELGVLNKEVSSSIETNTNKINYSVEINIEEMECLVEAIYFEARSEPFDGQIAVANVILNRVSHYKFPSNICSVVRAGKINSKGNPVRNKCAFSYWCDGKPEDIVNSSAYRTATDAAVIALEGFVINGLDRATFYHAENVKPKWSKTKKFIRQLGTHLFYE